jgi:hypothetical protein
MKLTYITGLNLVEIDLSPPEISIESEVYATPVISIEGIDTSLIHTDVPDIEHTTYLKAEIVGIDTSELRLGEKRPAHITLKNTGTETIKTEKIVIAASRDFGWGDQKQSETVDKYVEIKPDESKTLEHRILLPETYDLWIYTLDLEGEYDVTINVLVNGQLSLVKETKVRLK